MTEFVKQNLHPSLNTHLLSILDTLPNQLGIYYIYDKKGKLIFLSKSKNIYKRVNEHFTSENKRDLYIQKHVGEIMYELTGTTLIATLKEAQELQKKPFLNRKKKKKSFPFVLVAHTNEKGYIQLSIEFVNTSQENLAIFESKEEGLNLLFELTERYQLCTKLNGFSKAHTYCYNHSIGQCKGACMGDEPFDEYNQRVYKALEHYTLKNRTFVIMDKGRTVQEKSIIFVENGYIKGYGFIELNYHLSKNILQKYLTPMEHNSEMAHLLEYHLRKHPLAKQIPIKD